MLNPKNSIDELYKKNGFQMNFGLERIATLLRYADNPQDNIKFIHITGTNGKGSVSKMIYEILKIHGLKTGLYTSPHLLKFNERIVVNDEKISDNDLERLKTYFLKISELNDDFGKLGKPTFFELTTAVCFKYFEEKKVDIAVVEVGLGGSLDATNVIKKPLISIITNISMDHAGILGNSLEKIAIDKAGIIKENSIVVTGENKVKIRGLIFNCALQKKTVPFSTKMVQLAKKNDTYNYQGVYNFFKDINLSNLAPYQKYNLSIALLSVEILFYKYKSLTKIDLQEDLVKQGISNFKNEGRFEIIELKDGVAILDGAHNPDGVKNLIASLKTTFKDRSYIVIFGVMKDKDYKTMLRRLSHLAAKIIFTKADNERSMDPALLKIEAEKSGFFKNSYISDNISESLNIAFNIRLNNELILICGSLYLLGDFKKLNFK